MSIMEIAKMWPDQVGPEIVIANSDITDKEVILQQLKTGGRSQTSDGSEQKKSKSTAKKLKHTKDFVNVVR